MWFSLSNAVVALSALTSVVTAQKVPITGFKIASGAAVPLRKNINDLQAAGGAQWDLYIRSLVDMYSTSPNDQLSYFQIAGIHGKPYVQWNNAGAATSNGWLGYCPHGENLFLPWHRPYVVLYEQRLVATAIKLANAYPSSVRAKYVAAANSLRAPFWDWGASPNVPSATVPTTLTVTGPSGKITVSNPLRYYKFPSAAINQQFGSFNRDPQIYKCRAPESYPNSANAAMATRGYKKSVYDAFTRSTTFNQFSSTGSSGISLEQIHNSIHWDGSCGYQFVDADYAAFDPLFMLHHCNVDRLWAYWQAIKPSQSIFSGSYSGGARFSTPGGTTITTSSPLKPFFQSNGAFHSTNTIKSISSFGYAYEGLEYWKKSSAQMQTDATALINRLYGTGVSAPSMKKRDGEQVTRYFAQIKVNVEELARPCSINLYANTTQVGNFIVLMLPATGFYNGQFSLDKAADPAAVNDEKTSTVVDDLITSLRIEILRHDGSVIPLDTVPSLKIQVENVEVIPPSTDTQLPEYKDSDTTTAPKKEVEDPGNNNP